MLIKGVVERDAFPLQIVVAPFAIVDAVGTGVETGFAIIRVKAGAHGTRWSSARIDFKRLAWV